MSSTFIAPRRGVFQGNRLLATIGVFGCLTLTADEGSCLARHFARHDARTKASADCVRADFAVMELTDITVAFRKHRATVTGTLYGGARVKAFIFDNTMTELLSVAGKGWTPLPADPRPFADNPQAKGIWAQMTATYQTSLGGCGLHAPTQPMPVLAAH